MSYVQQAYADMANDQRRAADQRAANATLRRAEHEHGRTMALCVASLNELHKLDPSNLIFVPQVRERVSRVGGVLIDRSSSFQPVHDLTFDLPSILKVVQDEHEAAKAAVISNLEAAKATSHRYFFRFWKKYGQVAGLRFNSVFAAETARRGALQLARDAQLGDELSLRRLLAAQTKPVN